MEAPALLEKIKEEKIDAEIKQEEVHFELIKVEENYSCDEDEEIELKAENDQFAEVKHKAEFKDETEEGKMIEFISVKVEQEDNERTESTENQADPLTPCHATEFKAEPTLSTEACTSQEIDAQEPIINIWSKNPLLNHHQELTHVGSNSRDTSQHNYNCTSKKLLSSAESSHSTFQEPAAESESVCAKKKPCTNHEISPSKHRDHNINRNTGDTVTPESQSHTIKNKKQTHGRKKIYKCAECDCAFIHVGSLKRHMTVHSGKVRYKCTVCGYTCIYSGLLKRHMKLHAGEKPFKCSKCDYYCTESEELKRHVKLHSFEKLYTCTVCDYTCYQSSRHKQHMKLHTGEKPFKCSVCSYCCIQSSTLKQHMKSHTGEKNYKCTVCNYSGINSVAVKRHVMNVHIREKPYECAVCGYTCCQKGNLKRHMVLHSGEKPCKCSICGYSCVQACNLKRHMKKHTRKNI